MEEFSIVYYDGLSSAGKRATLDFKLYAFLIKLVDTNHSEQFIEWDVTKIHKIETINNLHIIRYGDFPSQQIECSQEGFLPALKVHYPHSKFLKGNALVDLKGWKIIAALFLLMGFLASFYFLALPPFAEFVAGKIPQSVEVDLGNSMFNSFVSDYEKDEKLTKLVNSFAKQINFNSTYPIEITVVNNSQINAFALPGGKVVIFDEIIKKMRTSEELAALLAHEVAHIEYQHSLKSISRSLSGYLFISLLFNDINGLTTVFIDNANALNNLSYSRSLEADADNKALKTLESNRINQKGMVGLFEILNAPDHSYLKFLSTHPLTTDRMKNAATHAKNQRNATKKEELESIWLIIKQELDK